MQAETTRTFNSNLSKLAGGLLITAALAAGAIGLTTIGDLEIPGTGSNAASITAPVADRHFAPYFGEGLMHSAAPAAISVERASTARQIVAPQGEGYPLAREIAEIVARPAGSLSQTHKIDAPLGEGYPLVELEQSGQHFNPLGEGLVMGSGQ